MYNISHHIFNNPNQKTLVSCLWEVLHILGTEGICFPVKKKKAKQKPTYQNPHTDPPFVSLLYTDLSTVVREEVHWIYRILCCSGSLRVTTLDTRFSALLSLLSKVQDPLCDTADSTIHDRFLVWCFSSDNRMWIVPSDSPAASTGWALQEGGSQRTEGWHKLIRQNVHKSVRAFTEASLTSPAILWYFQQRTWSTTSLPVQYIHQ